MIDISFINAHMSEQKNLEEFLSNNTIPANLVVANMGFSNYGNFVNQLLVFSCMLNAVEVFTVKNKDVNKVGELLAQVKMQKDVVYGTLLEAYGVVHIKSEGVTYYNKLPAVNGYMQVLANYVTQRYDAGFKRCISILKQGVENGME